MTLDGGLYGSGALSEHRRHCGSGDWLRFIDVRLSPKFTVPIQCSSRCAELPVLVVRPQLVEAKALGNRAFLAGTGSHCGVSAIEHLARHQPAYRSIATVGGSDHASPSY